MMVDFMKMKSVKRSFGQKINMSKYIEVYQRQTGKVLSGDAKLLDSIFKKIDTNQLLPPLGQQAVDLGLTAHTFNDSKVLLEIYHYYHWIINNYFADKTINELNANLIGNSFVSANIIGTDLPQPITLNSWQINQLETVKIINNKAVIVENNGVFIWLHQLHPNWPLINQSDNNFNRYYNLFLKKLVGQGLKVTYLGDLDSEGIKIANHLSSLIGEHIFELQNSDQAFDWLVRYGKLDANRSKAVNVVNPILQREADSIHTLGRFVEQEQLIQEYEPIVEQWLNE